MRRILILLALLQAGIAAADDDLDEAFDKGVMIIHASEHACYRFDIYIAENDTQRARGLMHVRSLPESKGMIFIYEADRYMSMWMKNTFVPLDILFVRADGTVSSVAYDTEPQSLRSISSLEPVRFVLEINAGVAEKLSIDQYSQIEWERAEGDE